MSRLFKTLQWGVAGLTAALLVGCERPPVTAIQNGYRGTGMEQVNNPRIDAVTVAANRAPASPAPAPADGPKAKEVYQNVKILGDLSVAEFTRHMSSITEWVSPKEGCAYCHNLANLADDSKYTKVVARRMLEMTQHLNANWKNHVGGTGVTCYTCHRGQNVPGQVWYAPLDRKYAANSVMGDLAGQNLASASVGLSSLPFDPFTPYLKEAKPIRVEGQVALRQTGDARNLASTKQAEHTHGLMMHMSNSLGVNCTFCHNTRNFAGWGDAPPQRVTAWHGIRMARDLNVAYLEPLTTTFPANRLGPKGDVAKVNCATCHQGANKPLLGAQMAKAHPELLSVLATMSAPAAAAPMADKLVFFFGTGKDTLDAAQPQPTEQLIAAMNSNAALKASISGFHSAAGALAANQDLAKRRAFAVRDMLLKAGIASDRVVLDKPQSAEAGLAGDDPNARRTEVTLK